MDAARNPTPDDMPAPAAALVLWEVTTLSLVKTLGPKKGERFVRLLADYMADQLNFASVAPIRPPPTWPGTREARREAFAYFRQHVATFVAALPR